MSSSIIELKAAEYPVKSVTVFKSSKAEVVRIFSLDLKAGQNKIDVTGLSSSIDTQSIRVSGLGDVSLFDIVCTVEASTPFSNNSSEVLRLLNAKKYNLEGQKRVREHEADLLVNYAKTLSGAHITPAQMNEFLAGFVENGRKNLDAGAALDEQIIEVTRQIENEKVRAATKAGTANGRVSLVLATKKEIQVEIKLTYLVSNATWIPAYELYATTDNGKPSSSVSLRYRAHIQQSTGEDWKDTALTLNTVPSDSSNDRLPRLKTSKIILGGLFGNNPRPGPGYTAGGLFGNAQGSRVPFVATAAQSSTPSLFGGAQPSAQPAAPAFSFGSSSSAAPASAPSALNTQPEDTFEKVERPILNPFSEPTTVVTESPLAMSYSVEGMSTVLSDGIMHQVSIATLPFEGKITYVVIPQVQARVYLQCTVKNKSEYRLLSGPVNVFLDDSFISKTSIPEINVGDTFDCTLGTDTSIHVTYTRATQTTRSAGGSFAEVHNTTTYTAITRIWNKHRSAIANLVVRDSLPVSDDKRVRVVLKQPEGLADAQGRESVRIDSLDGVKIRWGETVEGKDGEKDGRFEWFGKIDAGEQIKLEAQWDIRAPTDATLAETSL